MPGHTPSATASIPATAAITPFVLPLRPGDARPVFHFAEPLINFAFCHISILPFLFIRFIHAGIIKRQLEFVCAIGENDSLRFNFFNCQIAQPRAFLHHVVADHGQRSLAEHHRLELQPVECLGDAAELLRILTGIRNNLHSFIMRRCRLMNFIVGERITCESSGTAPVSPSR